MGLHTRLKRNKFSFPNDSIGSNIGYMRLEVLGVGNAFTAIHNNTSFLITAEKRILVDGPQGLFRILQQRGLGPGDIDAVIVTHIHGDHVSGLETLLLWKRGIQGVRTPLFTSKQVYKELEEKFFPSFAVGFEPDLMRTQTRPFDTYVEFCELEENALTPLFSGPSVEIRHNWHPTPTLGLKVHMGNFSVGISGDTCYRPALLRQLHERKLLATPAYEKLFNDWLWSADVVYHEADKSRTGPHTSEYDLLQLPESVRRKIRLVHVPDDVQTWRLKQAQEGEQVIVEEDSLRIELPD